MSNKGSKPPLDRETETNYYQSMVGMSAEARLKYEQVKRTCWLCRQVFTRLDMIKGRFRSAKSRDGTLERWSHAPSPPIHTICRWCFFGAALDVVEKYKPC